MTDDLSTIEELNRLSEDQRKILNLIIIWMKSRPEELESITANQGADGLLSILREFLNTLRHDNRRGA